MKQIHVIIISLKNSPRINILKKRLKDININFKIFYGINGNYLNKKNRLHLIYSKKKTKKNIDRELSPSEIGAAASHLGVYKHIIKKKISQAIIMEDDAYPSKLLNDWIKNKTLVENNEILSFYSYPSSSYLKSEPNKSVLKKKISIHSSLTHTYNSSCYQINNYTCKKIIKLTKNKVIGLPDWPFLINKHNIRLSVTIPFIAVINDRGFSYLRESRYFLLKENKFIRKILSEKIISLLRIPYYLSCLGFLLNFKNKDFYYEHYFQKQLYRLKKIFTNKYIDVNKIFYEKKYYAHDLKKFVKSL
jgi:GR25 family glycosyltransferase involved in LPS biosynthesis